jgi:diapolycopene oxygenase
MPDGTPIVVVGGGLGGLAAAIRLAAQGHRVALFERNERVGGKLNLHVE